MGPQLDLDLLGAFCLEDSDLSKVGQQAQIFAAISLQPTCFKADHKVLQLATSEKFAEVVLKAVVDKVARIARVPDIEEAMGHWGACLVSFQLWMDLSYRMVDQLCCQDLLHQIEVQLLTMVFWTQLISRTFQGVSTMIVERVPDTKQLEGFIFATILKLACIQIRAPLHHQSFHIGFMALIVSVLQINSQVIDFG